MEIMQSLVACAALLLSSSCIHADWTHDEAENKIYTQKTCMEEAHLEHHADEAHYGNAAFNVTDTTLWYTISTNSYPTTTPLSVGRNHGVSKGRLYLSPTGFTIGESGNYWVNVTAIFQNPNSDPILIPVFLVRNEELDPTDTSALGGVVSLQPGEINTMNGAGVVMNLKAGTRLSLAATNAGAPDPIAVTVVAWEISLFKLPSK